MAREALAFGAFRACPHEHGMGKIGAHDACRAYASESEGEIASAAAEIKDHSIAVLEYGSKTARSALAPKTIEVKRQEMVEQIITGGDLCEHLADSSRGVSFAVGTFGPRAFYRHGRGDVSHGVFQRE
jgi:hypothetical protein